LAAAAALRCPRGGSKIGFKIPSMLPLLSSALENFFFPPVFGRCVRWPRPLLRLPFALEPMVSNDLLSGRALTPVTRFSMCLLTTTESLGGADPIQPPVFRKGAELEGPACTTTKLGG